jgi:hypothetical protein
VLSYGADILAVEDDEGLQPVTLHYYHIQINNLECSDAENKKSIKLFREKI